MDYPLSQLCEAFRADDETDQIDRVDRAVESYTSILKSQPELRVYSGVTTVLSKAVLEPLAKQATEDQRDDLLKKWSARWTSRTAS